MVVFEASLLIPALQALGRFFGLFLHVFGATSVDGDPVQAAIGLQEAVASVPSTPPAPLEFDTGAGQPKILIPRSERLTYSLHFINEENIAVVSLLTSKVFDDFPTLKILVSHGGGAIPYQFARFEASSLRGKGPRFSDQMRKLYYDTVLYSKDALELLFKTVGVDRCVFGTERPGVGTVKDPRTNRWLDETRYIIEDFEWLSDADKQLIFEDNAKKVFKLTV